MTPLFTENTYNDARKALALATRINAEQWLALVQRQVSCFLTDLAVDPVVIRLAKSDIAETLLAKESLRHASDPEYQAIESLTDRQDYLQLVLAIFLFDWLALQVSNAQQRSLVSDGARYYVARMTGTDNPA